MKNLIYPLILTTLLFSNLALASLKVYSTQDSSFISMDDFVSRANTNDHYVLGEFHYNSAIHQAQANVIAAIVTNLKQENNFTIGWEFLNYQERITVNQSIESFYNDNLTALELMSRLFPNASDQTNNLKYMPVFEVAKKYQGELIALNATRKVKRYITSGGLSNLPQEHRVPDMQLGSSNYFERFEKIMSDHVPADLLQNFYEAQCYTDSIMAYAYSKQASHQLRFTVVGSFHSDYGDGYSNELTRYTQSDVVNIKVVNAKELSQAQKDELIQTHPQYGAIADFIIFSNY
jgi:uncharacterized iron-regulated protein